MYIGEKETGTDILINGAGPTGLMMACQLALHNISFRIIDKKIKRENFSGAMILHARSMEILHQMGLSFKFLKEGTIARKINLQFNYRNNFSLDIADFGNGWSLFPYVFLLEQSKIEKLLMAFLSEKGYQVEHGTTLLSFTQRKGIVTSVLKKPNGMGEIIKSKFLIGAGGSTSLVRRQLKIPFNGITHPDLLFVSDSEADMPAPKAEMLFTFSKYQSLGFFPLPNNKWRVDGAIPNLGKATEKINFEQVEEYLSRDKNLHLQLTNSSWFSVFRSHSRLTPVMRHHRCFLVGDAAHIHSPVGAQGMNTGLHDAYNLAWKLAFFLKGFAKASILDSYEAERLPVAYKIIVNTDKIYLWITSNKPVLKFLRLYILPLLLRVFIFFMERVKSLRKFVFSGISGIGINYRNSPLSGFYKAGNFFTGPLPGDRLPCIQYFIGTNIYNLQEKISPTSYKLLIFGVKQLPSKFQKVIDAYNPVIDVELIPPDPGTEELYKVMVKDHYACYLVRPDLYISWRKDALDVRSLELYLFNNLVPAYAAQEA